MAKKKSTTSTNQTPETNTDGAEMVAEETEEIVDSVETDESAGTDTEVQTSTEELDIIKQEAQKNLDGWQRTLAEFQNYKRRVEREQQDLTQRLSLNSLTKILPILDDFERALANVPEDFKDHPWMSGVTLIQGKFKRLLDEQSVEAVDPVGQPFDPNLHQAIAMDDSDEHESGTVIETLQKGYVSGDILLRPAMVRVAN